MQKIVVFLLFFSLMGPATAQNSKQVRALKNRREVLQKKIKQSESQLRRTNQSVKKGLSTLSVLNGQIEQHERSIKDMQVQIDSISRDVTRLNRELDNLSKQLNDKKQRYRRSMLYLYNNRKTENKLLFILSADNFSQMLRRYRYVREYAKYQRVQGMLIKKKETEVKEVHASLVKSKDEKRRVLGNQRAENEKLVARQGEQQKTVKDLQKKQKQLQSTLAQNKKEVAQLNSKIDYFVKLAIEQERKRREAEARERARREAERAAAEKRNATASSSKKGKNSKGDGETYVAERRKSEPMESYHLNNTEQRLSQNFASNKGRLPAPINGPYVISAHYGSYNLKGFSGVRLDNKGINLTAKGGSATARCIFDGEVSMVFSYGGMMNVLVRHGSYISVYCNLSSVAVSKGQHVSTRQTIGNIARDAAGNATLHFQLRKETSILNPEAWISR